MKHTLMLLAWPVSFPIVMEPLRRVLMPWFQTGTIWLITTGLEIVHVPYVVEPYFYKVWQPKIVLTSQAWRVTPDCSGFGFVVTGVALLWMVAIARQMSCATMLGFLLLAGCSLFFANGLRALAIMLGDHWGLVDGTEHRLFSYAVYGLTLLGITWLGMRGKLWR